MVKNKKENLRIKKIESFDSERVMDASWEAWHALGLQANGGSRVLFKLHVLTNLISAGKTGRQKKPLKKISKLVT